MFIGVRPQGASDAPFRPYHINPNAALGVFSADGRYFLDVIGEAPTYEIDRDSYDQFIEHFKRDGLFGND